LGTVIDTKAGVIKWHKPHKQSRWGQRRGCNIPRVAALHPNWKNGTVWGDIEAQAFSDLKQAMTRAQHWAYRISPSLMIGGVVDEVEGCKETLIDCRTGLKNGRLSITQISAR